MIRITLAVFGGAFYALLTYALILSLNLPSLLATLASLFVYFLYLSSRFLLLFSGINSPYYRRTGEGPLRTPPEKSAFQDSAQWVGKFYHRHDIVLFAFLGFLCLVFLVSIVMDGLGGNPLGETIQDLWNALWPPS